MKCLKFKNESRSDLIETTRWYKGYTSSPMMCALVFMALDSRWPPSPRVECQATHTCHDTCSTQASPLHIIKFTNKTWVTKAQQDLPVNMFINNRLLACNTYRVSSIYKNKPTLWVIPYFSRLNKWETKWFLPWFICVMSNWLGLV
jgi:hypothetical protein